MLTLRPSHLGVESNIKHYYYERVNGAWLSLCDRFITYDRRSRRILVFIVLNAKHCILVVVLIILLQKLELIPIRFVLDRLIQMTNTDD